MNYIIWRCLQCILHVKWFLKTPILNVCTLAAHSVNALFFHECFFWIWINPVHLSEMIQSRELTIAVECCDLLSQLPIIEAGLVAWPVMLPLHGNCRRWLCHSVTEGNRLHILSWHLFSLALRQSRDTCIRWMNRENMSEMTDVTVMWCRWQSLQRRMEHYNANLFTSNTFGLSDLRWLEPKAQCQYTCHNQQGDISSGK